MLIGASCNVVRRRLPVTTISCVAPPAAAFALVVVVDAVSGASCARAGAAATPISVVAPNKLVRKSRTAIPAPVSLKLFLPGHPSFAGRLERGPFRYYRFVDFYDRGHGVFDVTVTK